MIETGVPVRDPFILLHGGIYYMYGTALAEPGYGCVSSPDLVRWSAPRPVFTPAPDFDGETDFWAPECHEYQGAFYLFATYRSRTSGKRGVAIFKSPSPEGPFAPHSAGHVTPREHDCIDGTLHVEDGQPYMVYVSEWTSNADGIGEMHLARLAPDLKALEGPALNLFRADAPGWARRGITDGPFLYRSRTGRLLMLWSNFDERGYCIALARSESGTIRGPWLQEPEPLLRRGDLPGGRDGGHGMLFRTREGRLMMPLHAPNSGATETAVILPVEDAGDTLKLA